MSSDSGADSLAKLGDILTKMDVLIQAKDQMLCKLNKVEETQTTLVKEVDELKQSIAATNLKIQESEAKLATKADQTEVDTLKTKLEYLENRSKRNNVVVWGVKEGYEKDFTSMEEFIEELLVSHMQLEEGIEVMRAHRTRLKHNPSTSDTAVHRQSLHPQECCGQTKEQVQGIFYFYIR